MRYDVIVSGYISLDRVIKVDEELVPGKTSTILNDAHVKPEYGGCGINFACDLNRLGKNTLPIIRVGDDFRSSGFERFLVANRISTQATMRIDNAWTSCSYLIENSKLDHITLYYPGAMDEKHFLPYDPDWFANARLGMMTVASKIDNEEFLKRCIEAGIPLYLGMRMDKRAFPEEFIRILVSRVEGVFANEVEAKYLLSATSSKNMKEVLETNHQLRFIVVTKGTEGSEIFFRNHDGIDHLLVPILKTDKFVSTVGSGDAFMAGFVFGMLEERSVEESMYLGATTATFVIEGKGATSNAPDREHLLARFQDFYRKGRESK